MKRKTIAGQSLLDIAVQEHGSIEAAFDLAFANNVSITDALVPEQELVIPDSLYTDLDVANYFAGKRRLIATALTAEQYSIIVPAEGIGAMVIEDSFIVQ